MDKDLDEQLASDIRFALGQLKFKPPPRYGMDPDAGERYLRSVAQALVKQIKLSWKYQLKPPVQFMVDGEDKSG